MEQTTENNKKVWKGQDLSLDTCIDEYGFVYTHNGDYFECYAATEFDDKGQPAKFEFFGIDHSCIDDYFEEDGEDIAKMCGVSVEDMDYEWKFEAMLPYYGAGEFIHGYGVSMDKEWVRNLVKTHWND